MSEPLTRYRIDPLFLTGEFQRRADSRAVEVCKAIDVDATIAKDVQRMEEAAAVITSQRARIATLETMNASVVMERASYLLASVQLKTLVDTHVARIAELEWMLEDQP